MDTNKLFSFFYNGKPYEDSDFTVTVSKNREGKTTEYLFSDGLKVTNILREVDGALDWVTWYENTGSENSGRISGVFDCDVRIPFPNDPLPPSRAFVANGVNTLVYNPLGSTWDDDEFSCNTEKINSGNRREAAIFSGDKKEYTTCGGRSSFSRLPFFDINRLDSGVIFMIGWTGQWKCTLERDDESIRIITGIENADFYLLPGEKIRTSSVVMFTYCNGQSKAHNRLRSLIKNNYSQIGEKNRALHAPLSMSLWGGLSSDQVIRRVKKAEEENLGFEYLWIDAGWYGPSAQPCPNEFEGDWAAHTGDWFINKTYHPDEFREVSKAITDSGMQFLLWFEPERAIRGTSLANEHPDWFLQLTNKDGSLSDTLLLDLGSENALQWCYGMLRDMIASLNIKCYRQDFNTDPIYFWNEADAKTDGRKGIHEIKHIMGLYRLWDELLRDFPGLIIDNCASGGRRIDIETLRRSTPLWRSDYQCPANHDPDIAQNHTLGIARWIPFNGTSIGRTTLDTYHARSCYTTALGNNFLFSAYEDEENVSAETFEWIRDINREYKQVRNYMEKDFYPLTDTCASKDCWCAMQFDDSENESGLILAFRREKSPYETAVFSLGGIKKDAVYRFTDADTGDTLDIPGLELLTHGLYVTITEKRSSRLIYYSIFRD